MSGFLVKGLIFAGLLTLIESACPEDWTYHAPTQSCFLMVARTRKFNDALDLCQNDLNATVAEVTDETRDIIDEIRTMNITKGRGRKQRVELTVVPVWTEPKEESTCEAHYDVRQAEKGKQIKEKGRKCQYICRKEAEPGPEPMESQDWENGITNIPDFGRYRLSGVNDTRNWRDARNSCLQRGAHLFQANTIDEYEAVVDALLPADGELADRWVWTDGRGEGENFPWYWDYTGEEIDLPDGNGTEENLWHTVTHGDCLRINPNYHWRELSKSKCEWKLPYICEYPPEGTNVEDLWRRSMSVVDGKTVIEGFSSSYKLFKGDGVAKNWADAKAACLSDGAHLFIADNYEEYNAVADCVIDQIEQWIWTDGRGEGESFPWYWDSTAEEIDLPDGNSTAQNLWHTVTHGDCLRINPNYHWRELSKGRCDWVAPYICEYEP